MLLRHDDEAFGLSGDRVSEPTGQMIVIGPTVLVLDDEVAALAVLGDDVDAAPSIRRDFGLSDGGEIDSERGPKQIDLL